MTHTLEDGPPSTRTSQRHATRMSGRGLALFLALGLIWGMPYLLIRVAVEDLHPVILAAGRSAIGALVLIPLALRGRALRAAFREWKWLALYTLAEITLPWVLIAYAESQVPSSTAGLLIALTPILAALVATRMGDDRLGGRRIAGLALGLLGLAAVYGLDLGSSNALAVIALFVSACGYAVGPIILARKLSHVPPLGVVAASLILAFVFYLPGIPFFWPESVSAPALGAVVGLGLFCTALAFVLLLGLVSAVGPARATVVAYVNPVVAILLGAVFLGESLTVGLGLGFGLILAGSFLATGHDGPTR